MDIFYCHRVVAFLVYCNRVYRNQLLDPDPRIQQKTRKFYAGLIGVALFVLALSVIIIWIWDTLFNIESFVCCRGSGVRRRHAQVTQLTDSRQATERFR